MITESIYETANKNVLHSTRVAPHIVFERGLSARLWDVDGKEYLDYLSSNMGPAMVGHSHPAVVEAIAEQAARLISTAIIFDNVPLVQLLIFVVLAAVVGVLAAVWPARRAARMDVLRAITAE